MSVGRVARLFPEIQFIDEDATAGNVSELSTRGLLCAMEIWVCSEGVALTQALTLHELYTLRGIKALADFEPDYEGAARPSSAFDTGPRQCNMAIAGSLNVAAGFIISELSLYAPVGKVIVKDGLNWVCATFAYLAKERLTFLNPVDLKFALELLIYTELISVVYQENTNSQDLIPWYRINNGVADYSFSSRGSPVLITKVAIAKAGGSMTLSNPILPSEILSFSN